MRLFVDMDGVLADFDTGYGDAFGCRPSKSDDNVDWNLVRERDGFYRDLPPMSDFDELWRGVSMFSPIILTGVPSSVPEAEENKRQWVQKHIGAGQTMIGCRSADKYLHSATGDILIDDWEKYRSLWEARGNKWITHVSARSSLDQLYAHLWRVAQ